jgi:hypothetical protein
MQKILFLFFFSLGLPLLVSAQALPDIEDESVPIVDCSRFENSHCENTFAATAGILGYDDCDNGGALESDTEDFAGVCSSDTGGVGVVFSGWDNIEHCCVPKDSVTSQQIEAATEALWLSETRCEEVIGGQCKIADSTLNVADFDDSCSEYAETPNFGGLCGFAGGNSVCCLSNTKAQEFGATPAIDLQYGNYTLLEQLPGTDSSSGDLPSYLENIYRVGLILVVLGAVFMIAVGGFTYMASAGNTSAIKKGKGMITDALLGLVIALFAWLILNIINPDLVNLRIDPLEKLDFEANVSLNNPPENIDGGPTDGTGSDVQGRCTPIPDAQLVSININMTKGGAQFRTTQDTAERFYKMHAAAKKADIDLKVTSAYRTEAQQVGHWNRLNGKNVAKPCSLGGNGSNHQQGTALDISVGCGNPSSGCNTETYKWLKQNGGQFGFNNNLPTDPPHWSKSGK